MRSLIRPALFLVVRLGLFFSVVAYFFGQNWQGVGFTYRMTGVIDRDGVGIAIGQTTVSNWGFQEQFDRALTEEFLEGTHSRENTVHVGFAAIAIVYESNTIGFGIRHWLVTTIFAILNGVLMWVYRKQGKELADE